MNTKEEVGQKFIEHYGVPGMRWGVRRSQKQLAAVRTKYKSAPIKLTNKELEKRIQRMEKEKKYNSLNSRDVGKGEQLATEIMTNIGRTTIQTAGTSVALFAAKKIVEKYLGPEVAKDIKKKK